MTRPIRSIGRTVSVSAFAVVATLATPSASHAQIFAHRNLIPVPLDDSTRKVGLLPGFSYYADMERGWRSAGDDRAWDARLAGTVEAWRFTRRSSLVIGTADELVANSLKDGGFNPRGISWELSIGAVHDFGNVTAQLDFAHYCRHSIDNLDPPFTKEFVPGFIVTERTVSANAPRLRLISRPVRVGSRVQVRGAITGERFVMQHDGRQTQGDPSPPPTPNSWNEARGTIGGDLRLDADAGRGNSIFVRGSGIDVLFAGSAQRPVTAGSHENHRIEIGWHATGGGGALELYGAVERLFDDMVEVVPRSSHVVGIGLRLTERSQF